MASREKTGKATKCSTEKVTIRGGKNFGGEKS